MLGSFLTNYAMELACGGTFLIGFGTYSYFKLKGKMNPHKLVYYNLKDRVIKSKKLHQAINDKVGGANKGDTFFKGSK